MEKLQYTELKLQTYLKTDEIPVSDAKNLYRFESRVKIDGNYEDIFK